jgi:hypothetical protein
MNCSPNTRAFLRYSQARNCAVTGQADLAIQALLQLKDFGFHTEREIEVRYHMINTSYALRLPELYGTEEVSKVLRLSPAFDTQEQSKLSNEKMGGFNAEDEIERFCKDFDINPENTDEESVTEYVRRFKGASGAKIIYFYHLEQILRGGSDKKQFELHYGIIWQMLKALSQTPKSDGSDTYFTTDAWYPLVFLYSVAGNFGHFDIADKINAHLNSFDGWKYKSRVLESVNEQKRTGSFLMLLHQLNIKYCEFKRAGAAELGYEIQALGEKFSHLRFLPAISQTVNYGMQKMGIEYDSMYDMTAQTKRAVSHWNYLVGAGEIHP